MSKHVNVDLKGIFVAKYQRAKAVPLHDVKGCGWLSISTARVVGG
jgi:hypothetical protein